MESEELYNISISKSALARLRKLLEKQIPKKVEERIGHTEYDAYSETGFYCPECGNSLRYKQKYCDSCGSPLDWAGV